MPLFAPGQVMSPQERAEAIRSGAMLPEDFIPTSTALAPPPKTYDNRPSSAQEDLAKSLGITVEELKRRQQIQFQQLQQRRQNKAGGGALKQLAAHLAGPASHVRTFTAEDFPELLDTLARYGKARALPPKNSTIFGEMIKNASEDDSKALTHVTLSADGTPQAAAQTDSDYLAYLVNLAGGKGAGTQALEHLQGSHPTLTAYPTHDAQGYWDKIIQRQPGWEKVPGTEVDVDSLKWSRQNKSEGGRIGNRGRGLPSSDQSKLGPLSVIKGLASMMGSAGRGAATTFAGIPGDLTRLGYTLSGNEQPGKGKTLFPDSSDMRRKAPNLPRDMRSEAYQDLGNFAPVNPASATKVAGLGGAELLARAMQSESPLAQMLTAAVRPMGIMKQKGGNWLSGSVEDALAGLKKGPRQGSLAGNFSDYRPLLEGEFKGEPRSSFYDPNSGELLDANIYHDYAAALAPHAPVNSWIDKALTKYVRNDMATPEDPIRALAESGILHVDPDALATRLPVSAVRNNHIKGDTPVYTTANSDFAAKWERAADANLRVHDARSLANTETVGGKDPGPTYTRKDPWLKDIDPKALVHQIPNSNGASLQSDLGFDHLIDELNNSINPESGLPLHLQFPADRLSKVTVPQAVERVSQINAWRAAQKAEADAAKANNAATVLHKEYPEKGMKWVQLKTPEKVEGLPSSMGVEETSPGNFKSYLTVKNSYEEPYKKYSPPFSTYEEAMADAYTKAPKEVLADALRYEGDTMGHCVGGYCDDVASGRSNIFSLRDAKGQPHVTVETAPGDQFASRDRLFDVTPEDYTKISHRAEEMLASGDYGNDLNAAMTDAANEHLGPPPSKIVQIKGKGNAKPHDDYLPYVQDFVKSGQWGDVGDLGNAGLHRVQAADGSVSYLSPEEYKAAKAPWLVDDPVGYAEGGPIVAPNQVDFENLDNFLKPRYN